MGLNSLERVQPHKLGEHNKHELPMFDRAHRDYFVHDQFIQFNNSKQ